MGANPYYWTFCLSVQTFQVFKTWKVYLREKMSSRMRQSNGTKTPRLRMPKARQDPHRHGNGDRPDSPGQHCRAGRADCRELERALRQLRAGGDATQVLTLMARSLTNKLLHEPTVQLRRAAAEGRAEVIGWSRRLFGLNEEPGDGGREGS